MKQGTIVKIKCSADSSNPALFVGEIGIVMEDNDGDSVDTMILVKFGDGETSTYWIEELEERK